MAQVPFFSFISGLHHLVVVLWPLWNKSSVSGHPYIDMAEKGNWVRAIDYFFSSSLMLVVTSILFRSPPDVPTLMLVGAVQGSIILIGYLLELIQASSESGKVAGEESSVPLLSSSSGPNDRIEAISAGGLDTPKKCTDSLKGIVAAIWSPFSASILVYSVAWASLLIPFAYAVDNAPTAVRVRFPGL